MCDMRTYNGMVGRIAALDCSLSFCTKYPNDPDFQKTCYGAEFEFDDGLGEALKKRSFHLTLPSAVDTSDPKLEKRYYLYLPNGDVIDLGSRGVSYCVPLKPHSL